MCTRGSAPTPAATTITLLVFRLPEVPPDPTPPSTGGSKLPTIGKAGSSPKIANSDVPKGTGSKCRRGEPFTSGNTWKDQSDPGMFPGTTWPGTWVISGSSGSSGYSETRKYHSEISVGV